MDFNELFQNFFSAVLGFLSFLWHYGWWGFLGIIIYFILWPLYMDWRRNRWVQSRKHTLLKIQVPRENEKTPLAAEQMFANLQGIWQPIKGFDIYLKGQIQEHISFEIISIGGQVYYIIGVPDDYKDLVISQLHSAYPDAEIEEIKDYSTIFDSTKHNMFGFEMNLFKENAYPVRTYPEIEREIKTKEARIDAMEGLTNIMNRIDNKEQFWVQVLIRPTVDDQWIKEGEDIINKLKGEEPEAKANALSDALSTTQEMIGSTVHDTISGEEMENGRKDDSAFENFPFMVDNEREVVMKVGKNIAKPGYETKIRVLYMGEKDVFSMPRNAQIIGGFQQFKTNNLNAFKPGPFTRGTIGWFELKFWTNWKKRKFLKQFQEREFRYWDRGIILNIESLATLYHLPEMGVQTPSIHKINSKRAAAPSDLSIQDSSDDLTLFARTNFREGKTPFGIKDEDRTRHIYIIGKTGMGKTAMLGNMIISDIQRGKGVALVDPHGDLAERILDFVPKDRINDVVYFNPADQDYPIGFNILENVDPEFRGLVASGLIGIFKKIWAESWGPRLEYILRYTILALLEYPDSTILGILRMLSDKEYRKKVVGTIKDPVVKSFWATEFENYNDRLRAEAIAPIQNKVGQFVSNPIMRNILGQTKSTMDVDKLMDEKKILLINLSKGRIGEDNSSLLGAMMITKMQLAAMRRAHLPEEERKEYYLYVDEFQNFATESFASILSEARKYKLGLTLAHQYITQMEEVVRDAVFGNVGTMVIFRIGAWDAEFVEKEVAPTFTELDLVDLDKYDIYAKLSIEGVTSRAFSATTLEPYSETEGHQEKIINISRERYGRDREEIEDKIGRWSAAAVESAKEDQARREKERERKKRQKARKMGFAPRYNDNNRYDNRRSDDRQRYDRRPPQRDSRPPRPRREKPKQGLVRTLEEDEKKLKSEGKNKLKSEGKVYKVLDNKNLDNILEGEDEKAPKIPEEK
ncbi:type IV secretory system conjugative DNA transfer family protein [Patescibacteria group bacterium]